MRQLFAAGIFAGLVQALMVLGLSVAAIRHLGVDQFLPVETDAETGQMGVSYATLVAWSDILIAVCLSMIRTRQVDLTARRLKDGFRRLSPRDPDRAASSLLVQLSLTSIGFAVLAIRPPPGFVLSLRIDARERRLWRSRLAGNNEHWSGCIRRERPCCVAR